ncbi:hypothetical protein GCM10010123_19790 [Pilimelia anulata]|uniref:Uncharacterized protein n=1 Tax=Pilimelia anulata TaxID=53371 RepID=A0A8J3B283_9ACTN|nr:hypothetical protein GCM10010123_19790 [Pilimelia anulata]
MRTVAGTWTSTGLWLGAGAVLAAGGRLVPDAAGRAVRAAVRAGVAGVRLP